MTIIIIIIIAFTKVHGSPLCSLYDKESNGVNLGLLSCARFFLLLQGTHRSFTVILTRLTSVFSFTESVDRKSHVIRKVCTLAHQLIIIQLKKG
jgi:hypothetical protein